LKATVTNKRGVSLVTFEGQLDFSLPNKLRERLKELYKSKKNQKIVFDLAGLEFVGSTGIKPFIQMLDEFNKKGMKPRYVGLSAEYERLFKAFQGKKAFTILEDKQTAIKSYKRRMWTKKGNA
jgi:anti-anti-sigma factor